MSPEDKQKVRDNLTEEEAFFELQHHLAHYTFEQLRNLVKYKERFEAIVENRWAFLRYRDGWKIHSTMDLGTIDGQESGFDTPEEAVDAAMEAHNDDN